MECYMAEENRELSLLLKQSQDMITRLSDTIRDLQPMAEFGEKVIMDDRFYSMKEAADIITEAVTTETNMKIGRNKLFKILRDIGMLSENESSWNEPFRKFIDAGYFHVKLKETSVGVMNVTLVTGKGLQYVQKKVVEYLCS